MLFGDYRIEIIPDTEFRLDGGAMFGVVPRVLWEKVCPPDRLNRIKLNMNCLFVETGREKILIETGLGEKWTEKQTNIYGIFREKPFAQTLKEKTGYSPEDITMVVNTHLHFDHAGGNTIIQEEEKGRRGEEEISISVQNSQFLSDKNRRPKTEDQRSKPQFTNARYFVSKSEFEEAENPHERERASYLEENWKPLLESGQLELKPDNYEVIKGLTMQTVRGHSKTMQTVRLTRGGETLYGFADLIPTRAHLPYAWIMGYDLYPAETLEAKKNLLPQAVRENWICWFYHDTGAPLCRLIEQDGKIKSYPI